MRRIKPLNEYNLEFDNSSVNLNTVISFQDSPCSEFSRTSIVPSDGDGSECIVVTDPLIMLFNQERLDKYGKDYLEQWINSLNSNTNNSLSELRKNCSDDDLMYMIKSRHLQSPSEILAWSDYMSANLDEFKTEISKLVAQQTIKDKDKNVNDSIPSVDTQSSAE